MTTADKRDPHAKISGPDFSGPKFYGRRKGKKLRTRQQEAFDTLLPAMRIAVSEADAATNPENFFSKPVQQVWLEIGFGMGEHLVWHAAQNPDIGMIGCEPFLNGIASLCLQAQEQSLDNIRLWPEDARLFMRKLKPASIDRCFIINSDPWPKTRHHKRRFIQTETLDELARLLKPGAELRMATDHAGLAGWLVEKTYFHPAFEWTAKSAADWRTRPDDLPETKFQNKGLKAGRPTVFLNFRRKG
jgi:tRNA (guanine-N7-)-methyltransferase